jgi:hypothetical protein
MYCLAKRLFYIKDAKSWKNTWETWFIFNLRKNKQISHTYDLLYHRSFSFSTNHGNHNFLYTFIHTWAAILCSTSRICPSWPRPWVRLNPFLARTYLVSILYVLTHPAACCLYQRFIFHTCNPPLTTRQLNTFIQVNILGAWYSMYNEHTYSLQHFFLYLLFTSGQAGWPRAFMSGTFTISLNLEW